MEQTDLDSALKEVGQIGRYQIFVYILICIPLLLSGTYSVSYVFTAGDLNYRCRVDGCENGEYLPSWLPNAVPYEKNKPSQCYKYNLIKINQSIVDLKCQLNDFDRQTWIKCGEFIYESNERTIVNDLGLMCDENKWKLALVGTVHNVGHFVNLLISGYFSDQYGRRAVLIFSAVASGTLGIVRTFAWDYLSFILLEFFDAFLGAGIFTAGFILAMEIVKPEHRAKSGAIIFCSSSLGRILLGSSAMLFQNWRTMVRVNVSISYITILYFWLVPESLRWRLSHGRYEEAAITLLKIAKINKTRISADLRELLESRPQNLVLSLVKSETTSNNNNYRFMMIFSYPRLLIRLVSCTFCWIVIVFVFYGLSLIAVSIGGNKFTDFILVQLIEIPAFLILPIISDKMGRKIILCGSFVCSGISLIVYTFAADVYVVKLILFLIGKFSIALAFGNIYIYNSELFPTNMRHTLLGICSAFGRIGAIVAPQAPLLNFLIDDLAMYTFGVTAFAAALVCLQFPETLHCKLPDTIEESLNIGKTKTKT